MPKEIRVIHIVPAAFEYFEDIKSKALRLASLEREFFLDVEVLTLQYGPDSKSKAQEIKQRFSGLGLKGFYNLEQVIDRLADFDIIHIHCPFLGVGKVWQWLKKPHKPKLCLTFYASIENDDMFSWFISFYNWFFIPRFFKIADLIIMEDEEKFIKTFGTKYLSEGFPIVDLGYSAEEIVRENIHLTDGVEGVKLTMEQSRAAAYFQFYTYLMKQL